MKKELEGCGSMDHIRTQPKRMIGNGNIVNFQKENNDATTVASDNQSINSNALEGGISSNNNAHPFFESEQVEEKSNDQSKTQSEDVPKVKKTWAMMTNPTAASSGPPTVTKSNIADVAIASSFGSMTISTARKMLDTMHEEKIEESSVGGGQFSDADDDESIDIPGPEIDSDNDESSDDGDEYASIGDDFSDEECDVYILDPEEVEEKKRAQELSKQNKDGKTEILKSETEKIATITELEMEFPSLAAASTVPYEGSDDEGTHTKEENVEEKRRLRLEKAAAEEAKRRADSLKPLSKSGKLYNSIGKFKPLLGAKGVTTSSKVTDTGVIEPSFNFAPSSEAPNSSKDGERRNMSRVIGGTGMSGQSAEVDDDGEGWVTSTKDIVAMKASGTLDPFRSDNNEKRPDKPQENLPSKQNRTACATTDFAMQNVILQMNLELLTVDGVRVRKLKSWVQRCSACFTVYTNVEATRLFCKKCGSSSIQRVAASVNGKTGRLKLHLKKNYQHRLRGTKYTLPKPGKQNRFMGDLLLSEDQLMYGALNQRVKQTKSKNIKASESIFGADIASTVGCNADISKRADVKVGFGRKNPNSTKFGRERRGKKKKTADKVCGLRRY
jgi:RNA-binding protein NOB1